MTPELAYSRKLYCSFCGKAAGEVRKLIAGPAVFICDECVTVCQAIIDEPGESVCASPAAPFTPEQEERIGEIVRAATTVDTGALIDRLTTVDRQAVNALSGMMVADRIAAAALAPAPTRLVRVVRAIAALMRGPRRRTARSARGAEGGRA